MRGFIHVCIIIQPKYALHFKEKIYGFYLLNLKWMKKWQVEAGDNQFLYKMAVKEDKKFKCAFRGTS